MHSSDQRRCRRPLQPCDYRHEGGGTARSEYGSVAIAAETLRDAKELILEDVSSVSPKMRSGTAASRYLPRSAPAPHEIDLLCEGRGMRATGGAVKPPARCSSKSHRICQIRPSIKPIAIATEISKTVSSTKIIGMLLSGCP